jgi:hypothetical protein
MRGSRLDQAAVGLGSAALLDYPLPAECVAGPANEDDTMPAANDEAFQLQGCHLSVRLGDADAETAFPREHGLDLLERLGV